MTPVSRLGRQIAEVTAALSAIGVRHALTLHVVSAEGLIGFKLQALVNDPSRVQDLADIRALLRSNRATLDMAEVRGYFQLFEREAMLDEILHELR